MSTKISRRQIDFLARNYKTTKDCTVTILSENDGRDEDPYKVNPAAYPASLEPTEFIQRWYLNLAGEDRPYFSPTAMPSAKKPTRNVYRYDWTFGITLLEKYYWDWQKALVEESALAIHVALQAPAGAPEAIPVLATLSALYPSRDTESLWETAQARLPRAGAEMAKIGAHAMPGLSYAAEALNFGADLLQAHTKSHRNWFLYQFVDAHLRCPVVEWRIDRKVFREYGPLLRGTLFLAFVGSPQDKTPVRLILRPQIRYDPKDDLGFIIPTRQLPPERQVSLEVRPTVAPRAAKARGKAESELVD